MSSDWTGEEERVAVNEFVIDILSFQDTQRYPKSDFVCLESPWPTSGSTIETSHTEP